jgi:hypothetical protein
MDRPTRPVTILAAALAAALATGVAAQVPTDTLAPPPLTTPPVTTPPDTVPPVGTQTEAERGLSPHTPMPIDP